MRLTTIPDYSSSPNLPFLFKLLIGGIRNVKNKYFKNRKDTWEEQYKNNSSMKMDCADQQPRNLALSGIILENLKPGLKILDVGCGNGTVYKYLSELKIDYLGIDLSEFAIKQAQERFSEDKTARFIASDFEEFSSPEKFDIIIFNEVLYYFALDKVLPAIKKAFSLLKDAEGIIVISMSTHYMAY
jgi:2-polyprenyl-6-hydroxyphenyl methylase/3-demethylubiquinone-9 3-methyltransferase